ncbi:hypothetical protein EVG20_g6817 [Dentipellis fragilis]|uniref:3'-5' exonuclease domain-containing protein n=1 Tax=Dentipellis fragilis TaxID=205917 RepID=A0A4Y9YID7_9AGAM|nr:hypothetical protein EVG20_g6817 [Dentipellis fragilis]
MVLSYRIFYLDAFCSSAAACSFLIGRGFQSKVALLRWTVRLSYYPSMDPAPFVPSFTTCTTRADVALAVEVLSRHPYVVLDTEGKSIGTIDGELSLLCLGTPVAGHAQQIFVMDMVALRTVPAALRTLKTFLERPNIVKIVFDGRMDSVELFHDLGVSLTKVLDLQVAEVLARQHILRESERQRHERLAHGGFGFRLVRINKTAMEGLHVVSGMQKLLEELRMDKIVQKDAEVVAMHRTNGSGLWMERPLSEKLLQYAANDIFIIAHLFDTFRRIKYVPSTRHALSRLITKCDQYVSRSGHVGLRTLQNGVFRPKGLLMAAALEPAEGTTFECAGCGLHLTIQCYQVQITKGRGSRKMHCRICNAIVIKSKTEITPEPSWVALP